MLSIEHLDRLNQQHTDSILQVIRSDLYVRGCASEVFLSVCFICISYFMHLQGVMDLLPCFFHHYFSFLPKRGGVVQAHSLSSVNVSLFSVQHFLLYIHTGDTCDVMGLFWLLSEQIYPMHEMQNRMACISSCWELYLMFCMVKSSTWKTS